MRHDVVAGAVVDRDDIGTVAVAADGELGVIDVAEFRGIVGRVAQVDLHAGAPLQNGQLGEASTLPADQAIVAVSVPAATLPAGLRPDSTVEVYADGAPIPARVIDVRELGQGSTLTGVSLQLDRASAKAVVVAKDVRLVVVAAPPVVRT